MHKRPPLKLPETFSQHRSHCFYDDCQKINGYSVDLLLYWQQNKHWHNLFSLTILIFNMLKESVIIGQP